MQMTNKAKEQEHAMFKFDCESWNSLSIEFTNVSKS